MVLGVVLHQTLTNAGIVNRAVLLSRDQHQSVLFFKSAVAGGRAHSSLECKRAVCNLPAVVYSTNNVVLRATCIGEKHFAEFSRAIWLHNAANLNTLLSHWYQQVRDACMLCCNLIGTSKEEAIVGVVSLRCPHLLAVDHPLVTVEHCSGFEACQVAATVWFAEALAPAHFSAQDLWKKFFLLFFCAPLQQRWPHQGVTEEVGAHRCFCICKLFCQYNALQRIEPLAAVFRWPRCTNPTAFKQLAWPFGIELLTLVSREFETVVKPALRQIGNKPRFHFFAEGFSLGCVGQHLPILPRSTRISPYEGHPGETQQRHTGPGVGTCLMSYFGHAGRTKGMAQNLGDVPCVPVSNCH